jgi:hypothetical protein
MPRWFRSCLFATLALAATSTTLAAAQDVGQPVTFAWDANSEPFVAGYRVYVGTSPSVYSEVYDTGGTTAFTFHTGIVGRRYYFAVSAYAAGNLEGPRSSEVSTVIVSTTSPPPGGGGPPPAPTPGIVLDPAVVSSSTVVLNWRPVGTLNPTEYLVEIGSAPGGTDIYNGSVGTQTSFSGSVQGGSYFARIRARTHGGSSVASNEVGFSAGRTGCNTPPNTPTGLAGSYDGATVNLEWQHTTGATSYVLQAGTRSGWSDQFNENVGNVLSYAAKVQGRPTLYVRVIAVNACGQSAASTEIRLP